MPLSREKVAELNRLAQQYRDIQSAMDEWYKANLAQRIKECQSAEEVYDVWREIELRDRDGGPMPIPSWLAVTKNCSIARFLGCAPDTEKAKARDKFLYGEQEEGEK